MGRLIAALIRHGDYRQLPNTPSAHQPFPLNEIGQEQARAAVPMLRQALREYSCVPEPLIDCSCLLRAWQTAMLIRDGLQNQSAIELQLRETAALTERSVGSVANLSIDQIETIAHSDSRIGQLPEQWKADSSFCLPFPGAESLVQAGERVAAHLQQTMQALQDRISENTLKLFVGHGGSFRHAALALGVLSGEEVPGMSMYHATPVFLQYEGQSRWRHIGGSWKIRNAHAAHRD